MERGAWTTGARALSSSGRAHQVGGAPSGPAIPPGCRRPSDVTPSATSAARSHCSRLRGSAESDREALAERAARGASSRRDRHREAGPHERSRSDGSTSPIATARGRSCSAACVPPPALRRRSRSAISATIEPPPLDGRRLAAPTADRESARAAPACLAISRRRRGLSALARASPPLMPPRRPSATAWGFFMTPSIAVVRQPKAQLNNSARPRQADDENRLCPRSTSRAFEAAIVCGQASSGLAGRRAPAVLHIPSSGLGCLR